MTPVVDFTFFLSSSYLSRLMPNAALICIETDCTKSIYQTTFPTL
jgi:hypothetical protein